MKKRLLCDIEIVGFEFKKPVSVLLKTTSTHQTTKMPKCTKLKNKDMDLSSKESTKPFRFRVRYVLDNPENVDFKNSSAWLGNEKETDSKACRSQNRQRNDELVVNACLRHKSMPLRRGRGRWCSKCSPKISGIVNLYFESFFLVHI